MGNVVFVALHLIAAIFSGGMLLFITIPAHLIYIAVKKPGRDTYHDVPCKWCKEPVHEDATVCPHCRHDIVPYYVQRLRDKDAARARKAAARHVG